MQWTDPSMIKTFSVKTFVPVAPWKTPKITLLEDALHNMPPFRGVSVNGALLRRCALSWTRLRRRSKSFLTLSIAMIRVEVAFSPCVSIHVSNIAHMDAAALCLKFPFPGRAPPIDHGARP